MFKISNLIITKSRGLKSLPLYTKTMSFTNSSELWKITSSISIIKIKVLHWPHNQHTILYNNLSIVENHIIRWYIQPNNCNKYIRSIIHYKMLKVSYLIITSYTGLQK